MLTSILKHINISTIFSKKNTHTQLFKACIKRDAHFCDNNSAGRCLAGTSVCGHRTFHKVCVCTSRKANFLNKLKDIRIVYLYPTEIGLKRLVDATLKVLRMDGWTDRPGLFLY